MKEAAQKKTFFFFSGSSIPKLEASVVMLCGTCSLGWELGGGDCEPRGSAPELSLHAWPLLRDRLNHEGC